MSTSLLILFKLLRWSTFVCANFLLLGLINLQARTQGWSTKYIPEPPEYPLVHPQALLRQCANLETHVLSRVKVLTIPDGDRTVVQADDITITYHPIMSRNGLFCEKESSGKRIKLPTEKCDHGTLDESDDAISTTPDDAYIDKMFYIGFQGMAIIYRHAKNFDEWKVRTRFPSDTKVKQKKPLPLSETEYKHRLCLMFKSNMFEVDVLNRPGAFTMSVLYDGTTDQLQIAFMTPYMDDLESAGSEIIQFSMDSLVIKQTRLGVNRNNYWIGAQDAFLGYKMNSKRSQPETRTMFVRSTDVLPVKVDKGGLLTEIAPNSLLTTLQLLGCPIQLCYRADLDAALVDEFRVIHATQSDSTRYVIESVTPRMYLFSGKYYVQTDFADIIPNGLFHSFNLNVKVDKTQNQSDFVFDKERTIEKLVTQYWPQVKASFPKNFCNMDGTFMVPASTKKEMIDKLSARVAWFIFKNNYVFTIYFKLSTQNTNQLEAVGNHLKLRMQELHKVFGYHVPKFVDAAAHVGKAVFLFYESNIYIYRMFMSTLKAEPVHNLVSFKAPGGYSGVYGFRQALYIFSYRRIYSYIFENILEVKTIKENQHPKELFAGCKYPWLLEENAEDEFYPTLPEIQFSTVKQSNASDSVWTKRDDGFAYYPPEEMETLITTEVLTEMTEFAITHAQAIHGTEQGYSFPILLGASMAVLFVFLLLFVGMEMLRRKTKRKSGRSRNRNRSLISSKSAIPSSQSRASSSAISRSKVSSVAGSRVSSSSKVSGVGSKPSRK